MTRVTIPMAARMALLLLCCACSSSEPVASYDQLEGVSLTFDHLGRSVNPLDQRMAESGKIPEAHQPGDAPWLRLTNHSAQVLAISTYSTYMKPPIQWFQLDEHRKVIALEDGMEITLPFGVENRRGAWVDIGTGGGDMFWGSYLPPGRSVLFSVPPSALKKQRRVYVHFTIATDSAPHDYRTYFTMPERD
jgi:hypothetical protein